MFAQSAPTDFPVRCDEPLPGEDGTWVLYGSGGCSLYDAAKLRELGNVDEVYEPAYVEDLDLGYRAWQRGWPSVYVAGAVVEHRHRATTTRYYTEEQLSRILEINYLRFVARAVSDAKVFRRLWGQAIRRLYLLKSPLSFAAGIALRGGPRAPAVYSEALFLALTDGSVSVFPGRPATGKPRVLVASPYLPFPLSHGGAVRMYNLMRRAAEEFDLVLVAFTEHAAPPPPEILADLRRSRAGTARRQPRPSTHRSSRGCRGVRLRDLPRRPAADCTQMASGHRPTGIHATRAVRARLRSRPHHPGGTRCHLRSLPAAPAAR